MGGSMRKNSKRRRRKETESLVARRQAGQFRVLSFAKKRYTESLREERYSSTACTWSLQVATLPSPPHTQHSYSILYSFSPYSPQSERISEFRMRKQLPRSRSCEPLNR